MSPLLLFVLIVVLAMPVFWLLEFLVREIRWRLRWRELTGKGKRR